LQNGQTKYTRASGTVELKKAVCTKLLRDQGLHYEAKNVIIGCGAKHVLYNLFQVILDPGDEVILLAPYWVSYSEQVKLAEGIPVILPTKEENGFKAIAAELEAVTTDRTKAIVLNSPCNPTGAVYSWEELEGIAAWAVKHDVLVVSDEIYEKLIYDGNTHISIAQLSPEIKARTFIVNGVSKTFAMTGWRIGYGVGDVTIIKAMGDLQSHSTSNPTSFCQKASVEPLINPPAEVESMVAEFAKRRDYMVGRVNEIPGLSSNKPGGAFYVFVNLSGLIGKEVMGKKIMSGDDFADVLLEKANVAVVPGSGFGAPEFIRLSYAIAMERIKEGLDRIEKVAREAK
jgi:aspartate aminotransferase